MTWLDWLGAGSCFLVAVAFLTWCVVKLPDALGLGEYRADLARKQAALDARYADLNRPRSPMELYLEGGGDLSNPRVAALLTEAERGWNRHHGDNDN